MSKFCLFCGGINGNGADTCQQCGKPLAVQQPAWEVKRPIQPANQPLSTEMKTDEAKIVEPRRTEVPDSEKAYRGEKFDKSKLKQSHLLLENNMITDVSCDKDFFYILSDEMEFSATEYKVLNSMGNTGLLRCKRMQYNGKETLFYVTKSYKSVLVLLPLLDSTQFLNILENLIVRLMEIKGNGFLSDVGLDIRINRIFVEPSTGKIFLTYIPTKQRCYEDVIFLEQNVRDNLAYMIRTNSNICTNVTVQLAKMMEEPACSLSNLLSVIRQNRSMSSFTGYNIIG